MLKLPKVIGHRGAMAYALENTLESFREARWRGATWVEIDVKLTADNVTLTVPTIGVTGSIGATTLVNLVGGAGGITINNGIVTGSRIVLNGSSGGITLSGTALIDPPAGTVDLTTSGGGIVGKRAGAVFQPANLHKQETRDKNDGELYSIASDGRRTMQGYRNQISDQDRWAVIAYLRVLQRAGGGKLEDVPENLRAEVR